MCLMTPGRVLSVTPGVALVDVGGTLRRAFTLLTPDVLPGDWVIVGAGAIVRRVDPDQATEMTSARHAATQPPITPEGAPR